MIDNFRTRSGLLLSGAAIATSFLGLALHMDRSYLRNRGQLLRLVWLFRLASILLTIEVVAWVVDLGIQA